MILVLVIDSDFKDIMDILYIAGTEKDQLLMDIYWLCLLTKWTLFARQASKSLAQFVLSLYCSPTGKRSFIKLNKIAAHLKHCKRVTFAPKVGWAEALGFDHLDHQVPNILYLVERVCQSLENISWTILLFIIASLYSRNALQVRAPIWGPGSSWPGWRVSLPEKLEEASKRFWEPHLCRPTDGDDHI